MGWLKPFVVAGLVLTALASAAGAAASDATAASRAICPLTASELSSIAGTAMHRVALRDTGSDRTAQCSFSGAGKLVASPQVFLTLSAGGAAELRDLSSYYAKSVGKLPGRLRFASRPDLGKGAFSLTAAVHPVTTAFFLTADGSVATLVVDLSGAAAGKQDLRTAERIFTLANNRLR